VTTEKQPGSGTDLEAERAVVDYLRLHPDILLRHAALVAELEVPHDCGKAVSLIEHQVSVLRDNNRDLRRRMQELVSNARDNEELGQRVHALTLGLIECAGVDEIFGGLYQSLSDTFQTDFAALRVFCDPRQESDAGLAEFLGPQARERALFARVLGDTRPVCGRLKRDQTACLFPGQLDEIGSGAMIPLGRGSRFGILAVCSRDPQRYHPAMGTVFLRQLGEIVSHVLAPHVRCP
jgi:uncharacterized protein YigA (DUF484 family)